MTPSFRPQCPNHHESLEGIPFPMPAKGTGICHISKCPFEFEAEVDSTKVAIDKNGNKMKSVGWKLSGNE